MKSNLTSDRRSFIYIRRWIIIGVIIISMTSVLTACDKKLYLTTGLSDSQLLKVGGEVCSLPMAMVMLMNEKISYEATFGNDVWDKQVNSVNMQDYLKNDLKERLFEMKCLKLYADNKGVALSVSENEKIKAAAQTYFDSLTQNEIAYTKATVNTITDLYSEMALAQKVYDELTSELSIEISDEEAKVIKVEHIFMKTYTLDAKGNKVDMNSTDKEAVKTRIRTILDSINSNATSFVVALETYNEDVKSEYTFSYKDMPDSFSKAAFALKNGELSEIVETTNGYHIIRCVSDYMMDETATNKEKMIKERIANEFNKSYEAFKDNLTYEFNDDVWNNIGIKYDSSLVSKNLVQCYETIVQG